MPSAPTQPLTSRLLAAAVDRSFALAKARVHQSDAEAAHDRTMGLLAHLTPAAAALTHPALRVRVGGVDWPNPVGLAAGFDKDARTPHAIAHFGLGAVEVGTLTPLPQSGNPRPRLFRLVEDRAVINRLGFNNGGQEAALDRLARLRRRAVPVGVNLGANKDSADRAEDYAAGVAAMADVADWLTINISSPNTPGLRMLQDPAALDDLLARAIAVRDAQPRRVPLWLKVAPDLAVADIDAIARVAIERGIDALIVSNTTISRPALASLHRGESGGLSGAPLRDLALATLRAFRAATGGGLPLIGVGGIASADDAYARIRAGASAVQLYSALVYEGPGLARRINAGLVERLARDGFATVADAVG